MLDPYTPRRIPDGVTVHWDGTADDRGWSALSPALHEQPRQPQLPAFLADDDMEAANPEPIVSRLAAALAAGPAARLAAEELAARRARRR